MTRVLTFGEIAEQADRLPLDQQQALLELLENRTRQQRRSRLIKDVRAAREDYRHGRYQELAADRIVRDIIK